LGIDVREFLGTGTASRADNSYLDLDPIDGGKERATAVTETCADLLGRRTEFQTLGDDVLGTNFLPLLLAKVAGS
jgi:hypothetical protein